MQLEIASSPLIPAVGMFIAILVFLEIGRWIGLRRLEVPGSRAGVGTVDGAVYALVALLIGFTFNGGAARFDARRGLVGDITNSVSTAWQRIDMLPPEQQQPIRDGMRRYVDALIASYHLNSESLDSPLHEPPNVTKAGQALWAQAVAVCLTPAGEKARMLLLPSLNELFDSVDKERLARTVHPPRLIYGLLAAAVLIGAVFVGYALANANRRNWMYMLGLAGTIASVTYVSFELEFPRLGHVRIDAADRTLSDLRSTMR